MGYVEQTMNTIIKINVVIIIAGACLDQDMFHVLFQDALNLYHFLGYLAGETLMTFFLIFPINNRF